MMGARSTFGCSLCPRSSSSGGGPSAEEIFEDVPDFHLGTIGVMGGMIRSDAPHDREPLSPGARYPGYQVQDRRGYRR